MYHLALCPSFLIFGLCVHCWLPTIQRRAPSPPFFSPPSNFANDIAGGRSYVCRLPLHSLNTLKNLAYKLGPALKGRTEQIPARTVAVIIMNMKRRTKIWNGSIQPFSRQGAERTIPDCCWASSEQTKEDIPFCGANSLPRPCQMLPDIPNTVGKAHRNKACELLDEVPLQRSCCEKLIRHTWRSIKYIPVRTQSFLGAQVKQSIGHLITSNEKHRELLRERTGTGNVRTVGSIHLHLKRGSRRDRTQISQPYKASRSAPTATYQPKFILTHD